MGQHRRGAQRAPGVEGKGQRDCLCCDDCTARPHVDCSEIRSTLLQFDYPAIAGIADVNIAARIHPNAVGVLEGNAQHVVHVVAARLRCLEDCVGARI